MNVMTQSTAATCPRQFRREKRWVSKDCCCDLGGDGDGDNGYQRMDNCRCKAPA